MVRKRLWTLLFATLLLAPIQIRAEPDTLKKATLIPHWVPQAQFAGYYYALEKGLYKKHGVDLTILSGGPYSSPLDLLKERKADFATLWLSSAIQARSQGLKLINIGQVLDRSALMLVAKKSSGILTPWDMNGKKVGLWGPMFQLQPMAFFKRYYLDVKIVPQSYSVNLFLRDGVDVASAMWYNEYHTILASGINPEELTTFFFHEHGLNCPEDGIYVLEDLYKRDPQLCKSFVKGSIEGWMAAFERPEEAVEMVMRNLQKEHIPATRVHQRWMLERMKDLIMAQDGRAMKGKLLPDDYYHVAIELQESGLAEGIPEFTAFYRDLIENGAK
jgi:NitT/TauT family transport system substrate-binding protein